MKDLIVNPQAIAEDIGNGIVNIKRESQYLLMNVWPAAMLTLCKIPRRASAALMYVLQTVVCILLFDLLHRLDNPGPMNPLSYMN